MKKTVILIILCISLALVLVGCAKSSNTTVPETSSNTTSPETGSNTNAPETKTNDTTPSKTQGGHFDYVLFSDAFDIDGDGDTEDVIVTPGPTSGLYTVTITASIKGEIKFKNTFVLSPEVVGFGEKDGENCIIMRKTSSDGSIVDEYHKIYTIKRRIVIDNLSEFDGYFGGSDLNLGLEKAG